MEPYWTKEGNLIETKIVRNMASTNETIEIINGLFNSMLFLIAAYYLFRGQFVIAVSMIPIAVGYIFYMLIHDN